MPIVNLLNIETFKKIGFAAFAVLCYSCSLNDDTSKKGLQPNIIFVLVDDLGYGDVGFNGSTYYETPILDQLANESLILDNAYMYPTCSPSRAALFTGKQSFRTGVYTVPVLEKGDSSMNIFSRWTVGMEHRIYSEELAQAGYKGIHLGKWHIVGPYPEEELAMDWPINQKLSQPEPGDHSWVAKHKTADIQQFYPEQRGFIKNVGGTYRGDPALEEGGYKSEGGGYFAPFPNPFIEPKEDDEWLTDRLTDEAIEFMDANSKDPFLINLHYYTVHRPIRARDAAQLEKYLIKEGDSITGQGLGKKREKMAGYATMIESMDENIGRLIQFLNEKGLRESTMIVFTSDNGHHGGVTVNEQMRGVKGHIYEGGIKVPAFVNWPEKITPRRSAVPISVLDYFPTMMDVAGIKYEGQLDGKSITPLFRNDEAFADRPLFWHLASIWKHGTCSVIRRGEYKLIQFLADGKLELYHLGNDPQESNNLADEETEIAEGMLAELVDWRKSNQVPLPMNAVVEN